ncbi:MAG: response regulator transcription factor [Holophagales bacterium]|nr:response regulator transcription factor [Holophagales bacterium]
MSRTRALLAGGQTVFLAALSRLLETEVDLVGIAEDGHALLRAAEELAPDIIVTEISLSRLNGLDVARQLKQADPNVEIVLLAPHPRSELVQRAFEAGVRGFVLKQSCVEDLVPAIREILQGRAYISPLLARDVIQALARKSSGSVAPQPLTNRQRQVLQLIAEGRTTAEAASILGISTRTIEFHRYRIMNALGLHSTAELTRYALEHGVVFPED